MDDKDIFVTLEANIIEAVKRLVQNARTEFNARAQKGRVATPSAGTAKVVATANKTTASPLKGQPVTPKTDATPKKVESKEPGNMMDVFNSVLPTAEGESEETPSESPSLESATSTGGGAEGELPAVVVSEPPALTPEEEAQRQIDDLALDVNGDLHGMRHVATERPRMARRKTHSGTSSKFDPTAPALPEPVIVALVPEPTEQERITAKVAMMGGPRQPMVNLGDLQKRGGARAGGPGRGGAVGRAVDPDSTPLRRQTSVDSSRPRPVQAAKPAEPPKTPTTTPAATAVEPSPPGEASGDQPDQPASPPPEPTKLPDLPAESASEAPQVVVSEEAPPLPSLPASTPLSPLRTVTLETADPEHLSLDGTGGRRTSGASAPALPSDAAPLKSPAKPPGHRTPGPPPGAPHTPGHHVPGPSPPPGRVLSPAGRKISASGPPPPMPQSPAGPQPLEVQVDGDGAPPVPLSTPNSEGESTGEAAEPEKKVSAVMSAARAKQPVINLADLQMQKRTPKATDGARSPQAAAAGPAIPKCADCGCNKFVMNPFKKGTNCSTCFHQHPPP